MVPFALLVLAMILDGILTYHGILHGHDEGNPFIRYLMDMWGVLPAIVVSRILGIVWASAMLYKRYYSVMWAMVGVILFAALVPWTYLLFFTAR